MDNWAAVANVFFFFIIGEPCGTPGAVTRMLTHAWPPSIKGVKKNNIFLNFFFCFSRNGWPKRHVCSDSATGTRLSKQRRAPAPPPKKRSRQRRQTWVWTDNMDSSYFIPRGFRNHHHYLTEPYHVLGCLHTGMKKTRRPSIPFKARGLEGEKLSSKESHI